MTFGICASALILECIDENKLCRARTNTQGQERAANLVFSGLIFDVLAMIALITVGSLSLQGRIGLPRTAGIGFLSGAGGVLLIDLSPLIIGPIGACLKCFASSVKTRSTV